ncbi:MAG: twin-arginine translocase TatA/TatE family subunit [Microbacterium sp.]
MFGLSFEKLIVVAVIAAIIIGPQRLPLYAQKLGTFARSFKRVLDETKTRIAEESGVAEVQAELKSIDLRQYDPRRIIREALEEPAAPQVAPPPPEGDAELLAKRAALPAPRIEHDVDPATVLVEPPVAPVTPITHQRPPGRWKVTGTSAHPRRVWVPDEPIAADDDAAGADDGPEVVRPLAANG